jgi:hypothetical protein
MHVSRVNPMLDALRSRSTTHEPSPVTRPPP